MARLVPDKDAALFYEEELTGGSIDERKEMLAPSRKRRKQAPAQSNDEPDLTVESGSEEEDEQSDSSGEGDGSSSDGASDLEGIPLASANIGDTGPNIGETKRSKAGTAQIITEEGAASKIGIVFSRILEKKTKKGVLAGSKSVQKRRREDEAEVALQKEAKQQRQQLTSRSHKVVLPKGHDPARDAREKTLMTVATKGVVQLFNALSKAQQARWNSEVQGEKSTAADKASKAALLKVLKPSKPAEEAGWKVLQKGFTGFKEARMKMKDFDRQESSESDGQQDHAPEPMLEDDAVEEW